MYTSPQLRKNYEHALQERNDVGLHLIERNEEVCVFHERLNMQEAVLREAALELMAREEEIRYLHMEVRYTPAPLLLCTQLPMPPGVPAADPHHEQQEGAATAGTAAD